MIYQYYPKWALEVLEPGQKFSSEQEVMAATIELGKSNVANGGGPFAAAVISSCCEVVGMGFNRVIDSCDPTAHAEVLAISNAARTIGSYRLPQDFTLVSTCDPCLMCCGAIHLSGVGRVVCAARDSDTIPLGFAPHRTNDFDRKLFFSRRLVKLESDILRDEALRLLERYRNQGGFVYTPDKIG